MLWSLVALASAGCLALLLLLHVPLKVRAAARYDGVSPEPSGRALDLSARYLFGALAFDLAMPLSGEGRMTVRLLGYPVWSESTA